MRADLVTQAAKNGVAVADIMRQTGHRSTETVARYVRKANIFEDNVSARLVTADAAVTNAQEALRLAQVFFFGQGAASVRAGL